jgi:hypothetical protein
LCAGVSKLFFLDTQEGGFSQAQMFSSDQFVLGFLSWVLFIFGAILILRAGFIERRSRVVFGLLFFLCAHAVAVIVALAEIEVFFWVRSLESAAADRSPDSQLIQLYGSAVWITYAVVTVVASFVFRSRVLRWSAMVVLIVGIIKIGYYDKPLFDAMPLLVGGALAGGFMLYFYYVYLQRRFRRHRSHANAQEERKEKTREIKLEEKLNRSVNQRKKDQSELLHKWKNKEPSAQ